MSWKIKFCRSIKTKKEITILEAAEKMDIKIKSPCGGKGKCGKCVVRVIDGQVSGITKAEKEFIGEKKLEKGYRLACEARIVGDADIEF